MARKRKILVVLLVGLTVLVLAAGIAVSADYDSPKLGKRLLTEIGAASGMELDAEGFRFNLLRGVRLEKVRVKAAMPGAVLTATAEELLLALRIGPLLRGEVVVDEIVLRRPEIELISSAEEEPAKAPSGESGTAAETATMSSTTPETAAAPEGGSLGLDVRVSRFALADGELTLHTPADEAAGTAAETTELHGLDLELREISLAGDDPTFLESLRATGEIRAEEVVTSAATAQGAEGRLEIAGGHVLVSEFALPTAQGRLVVSALDLDLTTDPFTYALEVHGNPLNTNRIVGAADDGGFGAGRLTLRATGDGSETGNLAGTGALAFDPGELPYVPIFEGLERLFAGTRIIGAAYEPFEVRFSLAGDRLVIEPFTIAAGELRLGLSGWVGLERGLELHTSVSAPRTSLEAVDGPKEILEALTDIEGRTHLPVLVGGSPEKPQIAFDRSQWKELAKKRVQQEVQKGVEKELTKALGKLLGGEDG